MKQQQLAFRGQFDAMDTKLLLQRYRQGGLLPDAEVALLSVLEGRGYSREQAEEALRLADTAVVMHEAAVRAAAMDIEVRHVRQAADVVFKRINLALKALFLPVIVFFVLLAIPVVGNVIVIGGAELLGCRTGENEIHPCVLLGSDIGSFVYGYLVDAFVAGMLNPFLAVIGFFDFLRTPVGIVWAFAVISIFAAREMRRRSFR